MDRSAVSPVRGHALLSALAALVMVGSGAIGLTAWTVQLLRLERTQAQREQAIGLLHDLLEGDPRGAAASTTEVTDGGHRIERFIRHDPSAGDPNCGAHRRWVVHWTDAWGQAQQLAIRTYDCRRARAY